METPTTEAGRCLWAFLRDRWQEAGLVTEHDIIAIEREERRRIRGAVEALSVEMLYGPAVPPEINDEPLVLRAAVLAAIEGSVE